MNKIITIGREFGSGGREIGKRLSELLGIAYYDREIIEEIAKRTKLDAEYVHQIVEKDLRMFPYTIGNTLHGSTGNELLLKQYAEVFAEQQNVLVEMAERSDCVIVGRCADSILANYQPFRIFVYADMPSRISRCREKGEAEAQLTDKQLKKKILKIDKSRAKYYRYYTGKRWGDPANFDLCINTSDISVKDFSLSLANFLKEKN